MIKMENITIQLTTEQLNTIIPILQEHSNTLKESVVHMDNFVHVCEVVHIVEPTDAAIKSMTQAIMDLPIGTQLTPIQPGLSGMP